MFAEPDADGRLLCRLCPHACRIKSGGFGRCGVRGNKGGCGIIPFYGKVSSLAVDPIEKKPLYHFKPGAKILSAGFLGCNMRCPFCQNWRISQNTDAPARSLSAQELVLAALGQETPAIAYTYSEPLVHIEYLLECMTLAKKHGVANVLVTNGCIQAEPAKEILSLADGANIDLKCFSGETYAKVLFGDLQTALEFIRLAVCQGVHVEITTLLVSGIAGWEKELGEMAGFIAGMGRGIPWHLSAYHADYRWNAPPTDAGFLRKAVEKAREKLPFVYAGNIGWGENDTACLSCGETLVRRGGVLHNGGGVQTPGLLPPADGEKHFRCAKCGEATAIVC
ncbi:MAG: AmmeMemoRadiSam system radical SAM enzyme [Spirochaetes bacterium]|nr:AmmeMemoRadiSam system radical SAM enzyme [Spirochaetota bacterium]